MKQVKSYVELRQGEKVGVLFTPRLYMFTGEQGVDFKADATSLNEVYALYADILFCAALNLWTLEGKDREDFPYSRVDFHTFSAENPKAFGKAANAALEALTGKSMREHLGKAENEAETGENPVKKKTASRLTMWLLRVFS